MRTSWARSRGPRGLCGGGDDGSKDQDDPAFSLVAVLFGPKDQLAVAQEISSIFCRPVHRMFPESPAKRRRSSVIEENLHGRDRAVSTPPAARNGRFEARSVRDPPRVTLHNALVSENRPGPLRVVVRLGLESHSQRLPRRSDWDALNVAQREHIALVSGNH